MPLIEEGYQVGSFLLASATSLPFRLRIPATLACPFPPFTQARFCVEHMSCTQQVHVMMTRRSYDRVLP